MTVVEVIELLEKNWEYLPTVLGTHWEDFYKEFQTIVNALLPEATRKDLEMAADDIFVLMKQYNYTSGLLKGWRSVFTERLLENSLSNKEQIRQICNRLQKLARSSPNTYNSKTSSTNQLNPLNNAPFGNKEKKK